MSEELVQLAALSSASHWIASLALWLPEGAQVDGDPLGVGFEIGFADPVAETPDQAVPDMVREFLSCLDVTFCRASDDPHIVIRPVAGPTPAWTVFPGDPLHFYNAHTSTAENVMSQEATAYLRKFRRELKDPEVAGWTTFDDLTGVTFECAERLP